MICVKHSIITTGVYAGFLRGRGRGPTLKCFGLRVGMSRAVALGVWKHVPQENFLKWCNFMRFKGYFQPLS